MICVALAGNHIADDANAADFDFDDVTSDQESAFSEADSRWSPGQDDVATTSICYAAPDENWVELQVDNFATIEEGNDYMRSDRFAANPIGVQFNPSAYLARLRAGESSAALLAELALVNGEPVGPPLVMP